MGSDENGISVNNVYFGRRSGSLNINDMLIIWRSQSTDSMKKVNIEDVTKSMYFRMGEKCMLQFVLKNNKSVRFSNIKQESMKLIIANVADLEEEVLSTSGGNWGVMDFGLGLGFSIGDSSVMEIPYGSISQCAVPSKNEIELQFHEDDTVAGDEETLVEMRLYVPPNSEMEGMDAEMVKEDILSRANISAVDGQSIVELDETIGTFLTPRGRYAIEFYERYLRMHGKTYDYKIMYTNINRCFLLDRPDGISCAFVISLEEPIRQGKQGYPHLVLQLKKEEMEINVQLDAKKLASYSGNLAERMTGQIPQLIATLFKYLIDIKVYTSGKFVTSSGDKAVKCALKAQEGLLYPLEKSFMFIHKPTTFLRYEDVHYVEFQRYSGQSGAAASRNFDLFVKMKGIGGDIGQEFTFSAIDRREFPELSQFLNTRKMRVRSVKETTVSQNVSNANILDAIGPEEGELEDGEGSDEDSDFGPAAAAHSSGSEASSDESSDDEQGASKKQKA